jgi:predicted nuclease with TOPRIM domain
MTHSNIEDYLKENQKLMEELNRANLEKEKLDNEIVRLKHENNELNQKIIEFILEQLRKTFGRSSDTSVCEQLSFPIFNEAEMEYDSNTSEEDVSSLCYFFIILLFNFIISTIHVY